MSDCYKKLQYRLDAIAPRERFESPGVAQMVGKVISAAANIAIGKFLMVNPVTILGAEIEGGAAVTTVNTAASVPVYLVGPGLPQTGDLLVCRHIDHRWVASRKTIQTTAPNPCHCTWPSVLTFRGSVSQSSSTLYFQNAPLGGLPEPLYTLTYGPRPAEIPLNLQLAFFSYPAGIQDPYYITMPSSAWFSPPIPCQTGTTTCNVYFYFWVKACQANVMVIDAPYLIGPAPAGTRGAGNATVTYQTITCNPFQMSASFVGPIVITGSHGGDDLVPDPTGSIGAYINPRIGL